MPPRAKLTEVNLKIAGLMVKASGPKEGPYLKLSPSHRRFQARPGHADISLEYHYGLLPRVSPGELLFASGGPWSLYRMDAGRLITLSMNSEPYCHAIMDRSFSRGEVYNLPPRKGRHHSSNGKGAAQVSAYPFAYPLDELILMNFLAQGRGVILHACGLVDQGQGLLFVGVSGAGKSTIGDFWKQAEVLMLSDDRIILRRVEDFFCVYGTPWHGDAGISSPESAPLSRLYFLSKSDHNYVQPLTPPEAAVRLLVCCFPPFYDQDGMGYTLELLGQVASEIPCYELGFVPDAGVVDFVRGLQ